jgi:hypothetical protein
MNYLKLVKLLRLVIQDKFNESSIREIEDLVADYLDSFKKDFEDSNLIPKQHFLVHYGRQIRSFGPLKHIWVMRFESKHSYFKQKLNSIHNFKNITFSLSESHQQLQVNYLMNHHYLTHQLVGKEMSINDDLRNKVNCLLNVTNDLKNEFKFYKWLVVNGIDYNKDDAVTLDYINNVPNFAIVEFLVVHKSKIPMVFYSYSNSLGFLEHRQSYHIQKLNQTNLIKIEDLSNKYTHDLYTQTDGTYLLPPKYIVS